MDNTQVVLLLRNKLKKTTQTAVAQELGVTPQFVYDVLRGARKPSDKILHYLGLKREIVRAK